LKALTMLAGCPVCHSHVLFELLSPISTWLVMSRHVMHFGIGKSRDVTWRDVSR